VAEERVSGCLTDKSQQYQLVIKLSATYNYTHASAGIRTPEIQLVSVTTEISRQLKYTRTKTPWPLVRKRTIPTERTTFVDEILVPTFADRGVSRGQRGGSLTVINLSFLERSRYFCFK
jgi:hypothetical protein